jgi:hypothetical protein
MRSPSSSSLAVALLFFSRAHRSQHRCRSRRGESHGATTNPAAPAPLTAARLDLDPPQRKSPDVGCRRASRHTRALAWTNLKHLRDPRA